MINTAQLPISRHRWSPGIGRKVGYFFQEKVRVTCTSELINHKIWFHIKDQLSLTDD